MRLPPACVEAPRCCIPFGTAPPAGERAIPFSGGISSVPLLAADGAGDIGRARLELVRERRPGPSGRMFCTAPAGAEGVNVSTTVPFSSSSSWPNAFSALPRARFSCHRLKAITASQSSSNSVRGSAGSISSSPRFAKAFVPTARS